MANIAGMTVIIYVRVTSICVAGGGLESVSCLFDMNGDGDRGDDGGDSLR